MKIIGYTALRYGADYLGSAIRSIIDAVDEYHVLYATQPSHGHWSDAPLPSGESENDLHAIAWQAAGTKLTWHRGDWTHEGQQRDSIHQFAPDADMVISVDSDEIYSERLLENIMGYHTNIKDVPFRYLRVPFIHYWRSFHKCILHDPAYPARVTFPKVASGENGWPDFFGVVNHMGYATRPEIVAYKWKIHGHLGELRRDVNWFEDVFMNKDRSTDLHPVGSQHWNYEVVNPLDSMPSWMAEHPFYKLDWIE